MFYVSRFSRRNLLLFGAALLPGQAWARSTWLGSALREMGGTGPMSVGDGFPAYPPDLARQIVTVAHFDLQRVKDLVGPRPQLARAAWDWGFGDWETPLGAASHMGRQDIAEYLSSQGASPSIFSLAMLGKLTAVKELCSAQPGVQRLSGPHSISLLAHARMGGRQAAAVVSYFESLQDAESLRPAPLGESEGAALSGTYEFGAGASQRIEVSSDMHAYAGSPMYTYPPQLNWTRKGTMGRPLFHLGERTFYPAGAHAVRIRFEERLGHMTMTVSDGDGTFTATRVRGD
jgi:hypothetical protein